MKKIVILVWILLLVYSFRSGYKEYGEIVNIVQESNTKELITYIRAKMINHHFTLLLMTGVALFFFYRLMEYRERISTPALKTLRESVELNYKMGEEIERLNEELNKCMIENKDTR